MSQVNSTFLIYSRIIYIIYSRIIYNIELENEHNDRYDHSEHKLYAGLSFLGFLGISPAHIIDGLITFLTRIMAVLRFYTCKVFPLQEHTVQTHEGLYFVKVRK